MTSTSSIRSTRRTSQRHLQLPSHASPSPVPPRLRSPDMLQHLRRNSFPFRPYNMSPSNGTRAFDSTSAIREMFPRFDRDEFSIQGPLTVFTLVSTSTIPRQSPSLSSPGSSIIITSPNGQLQRPKSSPPILETGGIGAEPTQFPFCPCASL